MAWIPIAVGFCGFSYGALARQGRHCGLALMLIGGALIAVTSARPQRGGKHAEAESAGVLDAMRNNASSSIERIFRHDAPMAKALLVADQHEIPREMRDRYARAGMVHMLSISGLHVAIVAGAMMLVLQAAHLSRSTASLVGVVLTCFYVAVIGAPAPAVRSATMLAMVAASQATQRPTSPWAGLAVGAFVPLVVPSTILDLGYQLSVIGIAGLIVSGSLSRRFLKERIQGWKLRVTRELLTSVVATIVTAPLIAWYFGRLSLIAPLANLAAGPVISILQPMLFLALALGPVEPVARLVADASHPLLAAFDAIATISSGVPISSIEVVPSIVTTVAGGAAITALIVASMNRHPARPLIAGASCLTVAMWSPSFRPHHSGKFEMHVLDVGQGDAILLRSNRGNWVVVDAGRTWKTGDAGRSVIVPYIMSRGGSVEGLIISHAHADHIGGAASVLRLLHPRVFLDAAFAQGSEVYARSLSTADSSNIEWRRVHPDDVMQFDDVRIRFLAPDSAWTASLSDPNEASTVALVEYGATRFLLTGDAEQAEEGWLLAHAYGDLRADVLKVAHHGSTTSTTDGFLAAVQPSLAIISVGADNLYGHPSADVLASLGRVGARTMRTDQLGTIVIESDGKRITGKAGGETWDISRR
jgi:competence protein ComEC